MTMIKGLDVEKAILKMQGDNTEVYVTLETDGFCVTWGDYIANVWEEMYDSLGTALARAAVLVSASEHTANFGFVQSSEQEFAEAWKESMQGLVFDFEAS